MARAFVRERCGGLPSTLAADAALLVSELVTNAVLHGKPPISLALTVTPQALEASVVDAGSDVPRLNTQVSGSQDHGRGLQIVDAVAAGWGIETGRDGYGTRVWFRLTTK